MTNKIKQVTPSVGMILPALILYFTFTIFPLFGGFIYSLTNWDGIRNSIQFIGLENYKTLFTDEYVLTPLKNTFIYAFCTMISMNVFALLIAVGLDRNLKTKNLLRACMFLPTMLSPLIAGFLFSFIFTEPVAEFGKKMGIDFLANNVLGSLNWALPAAIFSATWKMTGWYMVIYLAGLQTIPTSLYEAAEVDGAKPWVKFWHITFPLIAPAFTINMVLSVERAFKEFDMVFSLTNGGPGNASELLALTIYRESFGNHRAGYGSAIGIILFILIVGISLFQMIFLRRREENAR
jgi:raffinose/stachyose/melibiose transport system permease protein